MERRVHRLTPLLHVWATLLAVAAIALFNFTVPLYNWVREGEFPAVSALWAIGGVALVVAAGAGASQLWWSKMSFALGPEELSVRSGVVTTKLRTARYDRIQAVDVVEPLAARIAGLAAVRVEAAGGADSALEIAYLPRREAEQVREEILRAAGSAGGGAAAQEDYLVAPIPIRRSLIGTALRLTTVATAAWTVISLLTSVSVAAAVPVLVGVLPVIWRMVDQSWRFSSTLDSGVVNLTYGLANRRRQAVPLDRIHAVKLSQPVLWRPLGWWEVTVNVAGYATTGARAGTLTLLPVGSLEQALEVVAALSPAPCTAPCPAPDPATAEVHMRSPRRARWVSPVDWKRQTVTLEGGVAVVTYGAVSRRYVFVEIPHIQELTYTQGPVQRWLRLAHVRLDLVPGPVKATVRDLEEDHARELVDKLRARNLPG
ncbi:putative membrane protein [Corynebacterium mycetoides]|uniref:Putative membrane protein n=1 Tax=Corynebacterium mycetoides TaxID=38302 RepID=A0A1G9QMK2_9CORY|nr:PH domain-containing protein [Corynebacterium mycetoides]SDM12228.1 putative membrane protein [Corynebacterium mycetoides]